MGFFSWKVNGKSLPNTYSSRPTFKVYLIYKDFDGNVISCEEDAYEGYGVFGGMDYYIALAIMNIDLIGLSKDEFTKLLMSDQDKIRTAGITLSFDDSRKGKVKYPQLETRKGSIHTLFTKEPENCPEQGYFYDDDEDDEDDEY
jgi:hypothetical protein